MFFTSFIVTKSNEINFKHILAIVYAFKLEMKCAMNILLNSLLFKLAKWCKNSNIASVIIHFFVFHLNERKYQFNKIHKKFSLPSQHPWWTKGPIEQFDKNICCHFIHIQPTQPNFFFHYSKYCSTSIVLIIILLFVKKLRM